MKFNIKQVGSIIKGDEIDLMALVKTIWAGRRIIIYSVIACVFIGLIVAYTSPKKFSVSVTLLPSVEKKGGNLGGLSALAGMAGINLGSMMGDASGIPSELYPQVVGSVPYLMELMNEKLTWKKYGTISFVEKIKLDSVPSTFSIIKKYSIGLPWTIKAALSSSENDEIGQIGGEESESRGYFILSATENSAINTLKAAISVAQDKKSGLVRMDVTMGEPLLTAQLADKAVQALQRYIIEFKTKQSAEKLKFIQDRYVEAKLNYEASQRAFFSYKDDHRNFVMERMDLEYQRLSDAYDIASVIYKGLAQQQEQAKITVKEESPVFTVLEPVVVPTEKSAPRKGMIMAVSLFLGLFLGVAAIFGILVFNNYRSNKEVEA
jgi:uncharacterized protein involved in exopolysaccharide biosynthesis